MFRADFLHDASKSVQIVPNLPTGSSYTDLRTDCNLAFACRACLRQDDELVLEVRDDGRGFDPAEPFTGHLGLRSIQERTAGLGGTCSLESAPAQGTYLCVCIPARKEPATAVEASER